MLLNDRTSVELVTVVIRVQQMLSLSSNGHGGAKDYGNMQAVFNALLGSFKKSILTFRSQERV